MSIFEDQMAKLQNEQRIHKVMPAYAPDRSYAINNLRVQQAERQRVSERARRDIDRDEITSATTHAQQAQAAAAQQMAAGKRMEGIQKDQFGRSTGRLDAAEKRAQDSLDPWYAAGTDALGKLQSKIDAGPGEFTESPGYQFRMKEGQKAIERGAAARGGVLSGAALKGGLRYNQDFAANEYDNFLRRHYESMAPLERMSNQGMQAGIRKGEFGLQSAQQYATLGQDAANQISAAAKYGEESQAGGTMNAANIMAAQQAAARDRHYGYAAWKGGEDF